MQWHTKTGLSYMHASLSRDMIRDSSSTSLLVLKCVLSTFSEVLDGDFIHLNSIMLDFEDIANHIKIPKSNLQSHNNILTTVHATTKSFVPFCSAQDGESTDMNSLMF